MMHNDNKAMNEIKEVIIPDILNHLCTTGYLHPVDLASLKFSEHYETTMHIGHFDIVFSLSVDSFKSVDLKGLRSEGTNYAKSKYPKYIYDIKLYGCIMHIVVNYDAINDYLDVLCLEVFKRLGFNSQNEFLNIFKGCGFSEVLNFEAKAETRFILSESESCLGFKMFYDTKFKKLHKLQDLLKAYPNIFKEVSGKTGKSYLFQNNGKRCFVNINIIQKEVYFKQQPLSTAINKSVSKIDVMPSNVLDIEIDTELTKEFREE